jgi:hypothetical protein
MSWLAPRPAPMPRNAPSAAGHDLVNYAAPIAFFDHPQDGEPLWPCPDCLPWHVEVLTDPDGRIRIRQWHAIGCPVWVDEDGEGSDGEAA